MAKWNGVLYDDGGLYTGWAGNVKDREDLLELTCPPSPEFMELKVDRLERGRSAVSFILVDRQGRDYIVTCSGMMALLQGDLVGKMDSSGWIACWWKQVKQGQKYSIEPTNRG